MEILGNVLGGLGVMGLLAALMAGFLLVLVLPWWAIFDCAQSRRSGGVKAAIVALLLFSWGLGSVVYGLFFSTTRALRRVTVATVCGVAAVLALSMTSLVTGAGIHGKLQAERIRRADADLLASFKPATIPAGALPGFRSLQFTQGDFGPATVALARFTLAGPDARSARNIDKSVRHLAYDPDVERYFALTAQDFGTVDPSSGRFTRIDVDPSVGDFSWPKGLAYDAAGRRVYVMTSHVFTEFYRFDPRTSAWQRLPVEIRDLPLVALAHNAADDCLYGLEFRREDRALRRIHRFTTAGAGLGVFEIHPAIPVPGGDGEGFQLHASGGRLVVQLPPSADGVRPAGSAETLSSTNRILVINPSNGVVARPAVSP